MSQPWQVCCKCVDSSGISPSPLFGGLEGGSETSVIRWHEVPGSMEAGIVQFNSRRSTIIGNPCWNAKRPPGNHATGNPITHRLSNFSTFQPFRYGTTRVSSLAKTGFRAWIPPEFGSSVCRPQLYSYAAGHRTGAAVNSDNFETRSAQMMWTMSMRSGQAQYEFVPEQLRMPDTANRAARGTELSPKSPPAVAGNGHAATRFASRKCDIVTAA